MELSAIDGKLALALMGAPMVKLAFPAAVVCRRWIAISIETFDATTATLSSVCATFGAFVVYDGVDGGCRRVRCRG